MQSTSIDAVTGQGVGIWFLNECRLDYVNVELLNIDLHANADWLLIHEGDTRIKALLCFVTFCCNKKNKSTISENLH